MSSLSGPIPPGVASVGQSVAVCITTHVDMNRACHVYIVQSTIKTVASVPAPASSSKTPPVPGGVASVGQSIDVRVTTHVDMNQACHVYIIQSAIKLVASVPAPTPSSKMPPVPGGVASIGQSNAVHVTTHVDMNWVCHVYTIQSTIKSVASRSASSSSSKTPPLGGGSASSIGGGSVSSIRRALVCVYEHIHIRTGHVMDA